MQTTYVWLCLPVSLVSETFSEASAFCPAQEWIQVGYNEKVLLGKSGNALAQAAQGGDGVAVSGGFQEKR